MKTVSTTITCLLAAATLLISQNAFAEDKKLDLDITGVKVEVSSNQFSGNDEELTKELQSVMKEYFVISKDKWTHDYTHDVQGDSTGTMDWTEGSTRVWQWMIRPGGLASFTDENGITTYLAKIISK